MYAIIKRGGRQYKVAPGQTIRVDRLDAPKGQRVTLGDVLLFSDGDTLRVGAPYLKEAAVDAEVLSHGRAKKILVFKKKRRQGYHKAQGHRQDYTALKIISIGSEEPSAREPEATPVREPEATPVREPEEPPAQGGRADQGGQGDQGD